MSIRENKVGTSDCHGWKGFNFWGDMNRSVNLSTGTKRIEKSTALVQGYYKSRQEFSIIIYWISMVHIYRLKNYSQINAVCKHLSPCMWRHYCDVFSVTYKYSKIVTIFWIHIKRTERWHSCPADTNIPISFIRFFWGLSFLIEKGPYQKLCQ